MRQVNIKSTDSPLFASAWQIYNGSFPSSERRRFEAQRRAIEEQPECSMDILVDDDRSDEAAGFMLYWLFDGLVYLEHFAVSERYRGRGIGSEMLDYFVGSHLPARIVLDADMPVDEISRRRIRFYERHGFVVNSSKRHIHPNLGDPGADSFELLLLSYGSLLDDEEFVRFRELFCDRVCLNL